MGSISSTRLDLDPFATYNFSGNYTINTWYSSSITRGSLNTGLVAVAGYFDCFNAGASLYNCYAVSEPFHWTDILPNNGNRTMIKNDGPFMGHAPNAFNQFSSFLELGILHGLSGADHVLQFKFLTGMTGMTQSDGYRGNLYLYALA